jgi:hypothetical protein
MKTNHALLDFTNYSVEQKLTFCRNIIDKMTGNLYFPAPEVSLEAAKAAIDDFESSILETKDGSHTAVAAMHNKEAAVDEIFRLLAANVSKTADGDDVKILSSGFHLTDMAVPNIEAAMSVFPHPRSPSPEGRGVRFVATRVSC